MQHALLPLYSPLENTPHKASNGDLPITCRNRHCPKCQAQARQRWLAAREGEVLGVPYFHVVFTIPHESPPIAPAGSTPAVPSSCRQSAQPRVSREVSWRGYDKPTGARNSASTILLPNWGSRNDLHPFSALFFGKTGWSMPNPLSVDRLKCSAISAVTGIGLRSAIIGCWRSMASLNDEAGGKSGLYARLEAAPQGQAVWPERIACAIC